MKKQSSPGRRRFLQTLMAGTAAALSAPGLARAHARRPFRIGLLLPRTSLCPQLGENLMRGVRLQLEMQGGSLAERPIDLVPEEFGTTPGQAVTKASRLLELQRVDLLIGPLSSAAVERLAPLLQSHRVPLLVTGPGANTVRPEERTPTIFHNTLHHWQGNFALGAWAARHLGLNGAMLTSIYDSGFDHLYAFEAGVLSVGGRVETIVTDATPGEHRLTETLDALQAAKPEFIHLLHSDLLATHLVRQLQASGTSVPVIGSDLAITSREFTSRGPTLPDLKVATSWTPHLPTIANRDFVQLYRHRYRSDPDAFAMLGYESTQLLEQALQHVAGGSSLQQALATVSVEGPRGKVRMGAEQQSIQAPLYLFDTVSERVLTELTPVTEEHEAIRQLHAGPRTGWLTDYLRV
ncbi:MAG: ABC transporter substrate-binding protein [Trueperaceae bacterium]|nr:MAG: ABC transporter substrate-binding protein [Trueperaceae bacterium]